MERYYTTYFAQTYGSNAYGACTYNDTTACATTGTNPSTGTTTNGGGLVNTGFAVLVIATLACLLIFTAIVVRFWRRSSKLAAEPVKIEDDHQDR